MSTTAEWLKKILSSKEELHHWLERQYIGEVTAAMRIKSLIKQFGLGPLDDRTRWISVVATEEAQHAAWVKKLLQDRGIDLPKIEHAEDRYWKPVLGSIESLEEVAAAGHHAEAMRLVRIKALVEAEGIDEDIRDVFTKILPDEENHVKLFAMFATPEAIAKMEPKHQDGLRLLGLEI